MAHFLYPFIYLWMCKLIPDPGSWEKSATLNTKRSYLFDRLTLSPLAMCPVVGFLVEAIFYVRVYLKVTFDVLAFPSCCLALEKALN